MPARLAAVMPLIALGCAVAIGAAGVPASLKPAAPAKTGGGSPSPAAQAAGLAPASVAVGMLPAGHADGGGLTAFAAPRRGGGPAVFDLKAIARTLAATSAGSPRHPRKHRDIARVLASLATQPPGYDFELPAAARPAAPAAAIPGVSGLVPPANHAKTEAGGPANLIGATATLQVDPDMPANKLRFDPGPGKLSPAAGAGEWNGAPAAAMGLGYTLPDGKTRFDAAGVANVNGISTFQTMPKSFGLSAVATIALP